MARSNRNCLFLYIFIICICFFFASFIKLSISSSNYDPSNEVQREPPLGGASFSEHPGEPIAEVTTSKNEKVDPEDTIAIVVLACNRPSVSRCLDSLLKYRPSSTKFPIIVSQDCGPQPKTSKAIKAYASKITHIMQPDLREISIPRAHRNFMGYYKISRHYGWALNYTFGTLKYQNAIIVEDDLVVAPDFFEYFAGTLPLLRTDPTLLCVSAWNDNGKEKRINVSAPELLHRSDFFPGLGWMLTKSLWDELMVKWPRGFWDDWMREPAQRKERACIRPEISRTWTFGDKGVSLGTFYAQHLRFIKLNEQFVPFTSLNLTYLHKDVFDGKLLSSIHLSKIVKSMGEVENSVEESNSTNEFTIVYNTKEEFSSLAKRLDIMDDFKAGVPRTGYLGIVSVMLSGRRLYLVPAATVSEGLLKGMNR